jgi:phosphoribosylanthranilate isomerase
MTLVKLCGIASADALRAVAPARPDAVGFVLAESPRQVALADLDALLGWLPSHVQRWAVFRTPDPEVVRQLAGLELTGVQAWHGWDGVGLPASMAYLPVFRDGPDVLDAVRAAGFDGRPRAARGLVGGFVLDGPTGGGRGDPVDVDRAAAAARLGPLVLAGGLTPDNVGPRVAAVGPWAVDVASGIERAPAVKDADLAQAFVAAARHPAGAR